MFKKKLLVALIITGLLLAHLPVSAATSFGLYPLKISVKEGQTFRLAINVNPNNLKNYTVKASIKFPADLVSASAWQFAGSWQPLSQPGYDSIDNSAGILIKTAGYPGGLSKSATLGTITFKAKKTGTGYISFTGGSMALDEANTNQYSGGNQVPLTIEKIVELPSVVKPVTPSTPIKPKPEIPTSTTPAELATSTEVNPPLGVQPEIITLATNTPEIISPEEFKKINKNLENLNVNLSTIVFVLLLIMILLLVAVILAIIVSAIYIFKKRRENKTRLIIREEEYQLPKIVKEKNVVKNKVKKMTKSKQK